MKVAALDLGSNTFLLLVCDVVNGQITKIYQDEIQVTKLGQGVHANRKFHPEALFRAEECLREYSEIIQHERPERVLAMATSAARDVSNGQELFRIGEKYGIPIRIIPGHLEAQITFDGATYDLPEKRGIGVIDVGGGSTEVIALDEAGRPQGVSVNVGSVRLTEMFVTKHPIAKNELEAISAYADEQFRLAKAELPKAKLSEVIGVAGTPTTLAAVMQNTPYSDEKVNGFKITENDLNSWIEKLAALPLEERKSLTGMDPQRADVIVAGMIILRAALRATKAKQMTVSIRGVRYGVAIFAAGETP
jgi:exopolyphosphatase/guanosine-5'-triphosphate,3'-diphosphate pyrophosphatase